MSFRHKHPAHALSQKHLQGVGATTQKQVKYIVCQTGTHATDEQMSRGESAAVMQLSTGRDSQSREHSGQDGTGHMHHCVKKVQAERVQRRCLECACTTLGAGGWVVWVPGEWEELREEGLALDGREARSSGVKGHPLDSE